MPKTFVGKRGGVEAHPRGQQGNDPQSRRHPARLGPEDPRMRAPRALLALLALAVLAGVACNKSKNEPPPPAAEAPAPPAPAAQPVRVMAVTLGRAVGADKRVATALDTFAPTDTIYASVDTQGA